MTCGCCGWHSEILREHCDLSNLSHCGYVALGVARGALQRLAGRLCSSRTRQRSPSVFKSRNCEAFRKLKASTSDEAQGSIARVVGRLRGRSLDELLVRCAQALRARLERLGDRLSPLQLRHPGGARVSRTFELGLECLAGEAGGAHIDRACIALGVMRLDPELHAWISSQSDAAESGRISLLGYESLDVGCPPRWHRDPVSGIESPRRHWSVIDHLDPAVVGDHKVLWELNRHQYLLAPALCWLVDGEARRFRLIELHLESWLADNPPGRGINWVSSLELALRSIAWCWLLWLLRDAPWRNDLRLRLALSLEDQARHIEHYLSTYFSPNTHLTGEALGLFYVGTMLPDSRHASRWRRKGAAILASALERQVYPDGVYFEQTTQYQRYTAEIYLHYLLLAQSTGWLVPSGLHDRIGRVFAVLRSVTSPRGLIPLLGDDDGGLLLPLDHRPPDDVRALLLAAAVALEKPQLCVSAEASPAFAYWLCGIDRTERLRGRGTVGTEWDDTYFAHGGLAILRDSPGSGGAVAVIDAGPHGALSCGHSHADALAMTLSLAGEELFIDRGTLTYSGPERNEFRATTSHNTLEIDEESSVSPGKAFGWLDATPPRAHGRVCSSASFSGFCGVAIGHVGGGRASQHCRRVLHRRGAAWVIHDRGMRTGARTGLVRWQLGRGLSVTALTPQTVAITNKAGLNVATVYLQGASPVRIVTREVAPRLGQRIAAPCLELETGVELDALTIVVPAGPDGASVAFEVAGREVVWSDGAGRHHLMRSGQAHLALLPAALDLHADLIWWTEEPTGNDGAGDGALVAAILSPAMAFAPAAPAPAASVAAGKVAQGITTLGEQSGRMQVWVNRSGSWAALDVEDRGCD